MNQKKKNIPQRVAVVYPYFAHYRGPKIESLINDSKHHYDFFGDTHNFGTGIKLIEKFPKDRFRRLRGFRVKSMTIQPGVIPIALGTKYDCLILWGNCQWPTMWLAAILARLRGKRVLYFCHGWIRNDRGLKGWFRNTFYKLAHGLLIYGHRSKCIGIENGFDPKRLHVIYNSLDCAHQDTVRDAILPNSRQETREELFGDLASNPILINITRLHHYKKIDQIIDAAAILNSQSKPVNVVIIGEGPHRKEIEELAKSKGVSAVFTGALYDETEIGRMLNASDVAVMPGPVGLLVMHALAYGVPVISNDHFDTQMPEFEAIISGVTGGFFKSDDVTSLAQAIDDLLTDSMTYEERYQRSREVIERFYNSRSQLVMIDRAVEGCDADDLFVSRLGRYNETT